MKKKYIRRIVGVIIVTILVIACCYVNDYYHADQSEIESFVVEPKIEIEVLENNDIVCIPDEINAGMIFYPGGKVEYTAYLPLMKACASKGVLTVLTKMPCNLAVLDINAADGIREKYPEVSKWYMAGHSLGGTMAASYIKNNMEEFEGLILLGSYTTEKLEAAELAVLSIYGSEDKVMNMENYIENKEKLPEMFAEQILTGGNHAGFGMYGAQDGDGVATITNEAQIWMTAESICDFVIE